MSKNDFHVIFRHEVLHRKTPRAYKHKKPLARESSVAGNRREHEQFFERHNYRGGGNVGSNVIGFGVPVFLQPGQENL
jgi:hypothetical protein